jgi:hypothetical protein
MVTRSAVLENCVHNIVQECQMFRDIVLSAILETSTDTKDKEKTLFIGVDWMNATLALVRIGH